MWFWIAKNASLGIGNGIKCSENSTLTILYFIHYLLIMQYDVEMPISPEQRYFNIRNALWYMKVILFHFKRKHLSYFPKSIFKTWLWIYLGIKINLHLVCSQRYLACFVMVYLIASFLVFIMLSKSYELFISKSHY